MIEIGIDLGADHLRVISKEEGVLFDEPCMVAFDKKKHLLAVGQEAKDLKGMHDGSVRVVAPLAKSPIDVSSLYLLLEEVCNQLRVFRMFQKTILLVSYPTSLDDEQCEALKQALLDLGAFKVYFDQEIWISAIGAGLDVTLPIARCVMNIGYTNCDIAIFHDGRMQKKSSCQLSGRHVNALIRKWIQDTYNMQISEHMAEKVNFNLGNTLKTANPKSMNVQGIDLASNQMRVISIEENQIVDVLNPLVMEWANWIYAFLSSLTQKQQEDVMMRGIIACGGTMLLNNLRINLQHLLSCPVYLADDPKLTVVNGLMTVLNRME
ncbi:MAG: rod shape-determining protein [Holdemanella sp.]|nr:rod shape-determining protein [Holdemanella sp.]